MTEDDSPRLLREIREAARVQGSKKPEKPEVGYHGALKETMEPLRKLITNTESALSHVPDQSRDAAFSVERLVRIARRLSTVYTERKRRESLVDYNDLLLLTRNLLRKRPTDVRDRLVGEFDAILIDEFQDTDPIQEEIVRAIAGSDLAGGRLFLVGDVKQSIYGFRGARPDLFSKLQNEFRPEGRLPLTANFRSLPAVLNFVNALFGKAFGPDYPPLLPGSDAPEAPEAPASVVFLWSSRREQNPKTPADVGRREEGKRIADYLHDQIGRARQVRDRKTGRLRPMTAGDVAILFRSLTDLAPYERALTDAGLDYHVIGGSAFYAQQEVTDLTNLLTAIEDPHDGVALAGVLRSPLFALSDEALYWLSIAGSRDLSLGLKLAAKGDPIGLGKGDRERAGRASRLLESWRSRKDREPIGTLIDWIFNESGYEAALLAEPLGDRKRANARKLVRLARQFDFEGGLTLADFVERLKLDLKNPPKEAEAATTDEAGDVVRLLSIHQAKGLEFPVVILPDLDRKSANDRSKVAVDPEMGLVMNLEVEAEEGSGKATRNLGWIVHQHLQDERDEAEALRVFYVATTRARDLLVLSSAADLGARPVSVATKLLDERFDRETGICRSILPEGWPNPRVELVTELLESRPKAEPRRRPDLIGIAKAIEQASPRDEPPRSIPLPLVRSLHLDTESGFGPKHLRLERLLRSTCAEPKLYRTPGHWRQVVDRSASWQPEMPPRRVVEELKIRLSRWLDGPFGKALTEADEVVAGRDFDGVWNREGGANLIVSGRLDLAYRTSKGTWNLVNLSLAESDEALETLRLALAVNFAETLGFGEVEQAWSLRLGAGGGLRSIVVNPRTTHEGLERLLIPSADQPR